MYKLIFIENKRILTFFRSFLFCFLFIFCYIFASFWIWRSVWIDRAKVTKNWLWHTNKRSIVAPIKRAKISMDKVKQNEINSSLGKHTEKTQTSNLIFKVSDQSVHRLTSNKIWIEKRASWTAWPERTGRRNKKQTTTATPGKDWEKTPEWRVKANGRLFKHRTRLNNMQTIFVHFNVICVW